MYEKKAKLFVGGFYENPVFRGDHPDPSVVRDGSDYWATTTSTEWAPQFPLMHSRDLVHWEQVGAVFEKPPTWAAGKFWAPEISFHAGTFFVYYVAKHKDGPLTIGVATAGNARGPYVDHGPLVGQTSGSIDPTAITDDNGDRYLIWKEDGNSIGLPTTIWVQRLSADGLRLVGEAQSILRNDAAWEGHVVEAPSIVRRGDYYYMFYSGNSCCGRNCKYAVGVARARNLFGPWQKYKANPILKGNADWRCPGHGSVVETGDGRTFYLYHAYAKRDSIFIGRQTLLDEVHWQNDGWPIIHDGSPSSSAPLPLKKERARRFTWAPSIAAGQWQWPQDRPPHVRFRKSWQGSTVRLGPAAEGIADDTLACVLARSPHFGNYSAETAVNVRRLEPGVSAGLCAYGDVANAVGIAYRDGAIQVWQRVDGKHHVLHEMPFEGKNRVRFRMRAYRGYKFTFDVWVNGRWQAVRSAPLRAAYLPPWDRGVRVALTVGGQAGACAEFAPMSLIVAAAIKSA